MEKHYIFSAPGYIELSGNHTEHQHGLVITAAIDLETIADVIVTDKRHIIIQHDGCCVIRINLKDLYIHREEKHTYTALVRGIVAAFVKKGAKVKGFEAIVRSNIPSESNLGSCTSFSMLICTVFNELFMEKPLSCVELAGIAQWAQKEYYGHISEFSGLISCVSGGCTALDFRNSSYPETEKIGFDFSSVAYSICMIDSGSYSDAPDSEYSDIFNELSRLCSRFGRDYLRQIPLKEFIDALPVIRKKVSDRAIMRALHVYRENERVEKQILALRSNDFDTFLKLCIQSGHSSWMYMQNIYPTVSICRQEMAFALALCDMLLGGKGACRVHGKGFTGTVQAFVPTDMLESFKKGIEKNLGKGSCRVLHIRSQGSIRVQ